MPMCGCGKKKHPALVIKGDEVVTLPEDIQDCAHICPPTLAEPPRLPHEEGKPLIARLSFSIAENDPRISSPTLVQSPMHLARAVETKPTEPVKPSEAEIEKAPPPPARTLTASLRGEIPEPSAGRVSSPRKVKELASQYEEPQVPQKSPRRRLLSPVDSTVRTPPHPAPIPSPKVVAGGVIPEHKTIAGVAEPAPTAVSPEEASPRTQQPARVPTLAGPSATTEEETAEQVVTEETISPTTMAAVATTSPRQLKERRMTTLQMGPSTSGDEITLMVQAYEQKRIEKQQQRKEGMQLFFKSWVRLLELALEDVIYWNDLEAGLRAHILLRLVASDAAVTLSLLRDVEDESIAKAPWSLVGSANASVIFSPESFSMSRQGSVDDTTSRAFGHRSSTQAEGGNQVSTTAAPTSTTRLPIVLSFFPIEILNEIPASSPALKQLFLETTTAAERQDLTDRVNRLITTMEVAVEFNLIHERWIHFANLMTAFGVNHLFNFDLKLRTLVSPRVMEQWQRMTAEIGELLEPAASVYMPADTAMIQSAASPSPEQPKLRRRRSLRKGFARMRHGGLRYMRPHRHPKQNKQEEGPWTHEYKKGVLLAYRLLVNGLVACKVRSRLRIPFVNAMVTLDDSDRFSEWVPYCSSATKIHEYGNASYLISYISDLPWPIRKRETVGYCGCVEALEELGQVIVFLMTPPEDPGKVLGIEIPPANPKIPRIEKSLIGFFIRPLSLSETVLEIQVIMDPGINAKMLRGIIPWVVKNSVVDFFTKIVRLAQGINYDEFKETNHPHQPFYDSMEERVQTFLIEQQRNPSLTSLESMTGGETGDTAKEKEEAAMIWVNEDKKWYKKLETFKVET